MLMLSLKVTAPVLQPRSRGAADPSPHGGAPTAGRREREDGWERVAGWGGTGGLGRKGESSNAAASTRELHIFTSNDKPRPLPFLVTWGLPDRLGPFDLGLLTPKSIDYSFA